jgi:hypothetical protein
VQVKVFHATATLALESCVVLLTEPNDMPPPYQGTSILIFGLPSLRRFNSMPVSISSLLSSTVGFSGNFIRMRSKPPPEFPVSNS